MDLGVVLSDSQRTVTIVLITLGFTFISVCVWVWVCGCVSVPKIRSQTTLLLVTKQQNGT